MANLASASQQAPSAAARPGAGSEARPDAGDEARHLSAIPTPWRLAGTAAAVGSFPGTDPRYLLSAAIAALVGFLFASAIARVGLILLALDALAMGLFVSLGAVAGLYYDLGIPAAVFLGVTTAIGGSILRDLLSGEPPSVFRPGIFSGVAALFGAIVFVILDQFGVVTFWNQVVTVLAVAGLRWLALWRQWESPSSGDFLGRLEDLLAKAAAPLHPLPKAPAAEPLDEAGVPESSNQGEARSDEARP